MIPPPNPADLPSVACQVDALSRHESDKQPDREVARKAARQLGVVSATDVSAAGLTPKAVASRVRRGQLHVLHRGVYHVGHGNPTVEACFVAAVKTAGPTGRLSHFAAAAHLGHLDWDFRDPEVTVHDTTPRNRPGLRVHRTTRMDPRDVTVVRGIPVTTPARTLVDLAGVVDRRTLTRAVRRAQGLHGVTIRDILAALDRAGRRRGATTLRAILATGPAPTRSVLEDVVLDLILAGGLPRPEVNRPLRLAGRTVIPDFRWPVHRLVVEADGGAWHDTPLARRQDADRQALLEAHGERVLRVTWEQAVTRRAQTLARLRSALGHPLQLGPPAAR